MSGQRGVHRNLWIGIVGVLVGVGLMIAMLRFGAAGLSAGGRILAGTAGVTALVAWWAIFNARLNRNLDEYQRWNERRAWYVGGLAGLLLSVPVFAFVGLGGLRWLNLAADAGPAASRAFAHGYMLPLVLQVAGSTAYAVWRRFAR